ncbi:MAG: 4-hydroxy-tetrahydrodipicolinate synthase [Bacteroidales bacterium]
MKEFNVKGTGVALVTPFDRQGNIDFVSFGKLINHVIEGGVDYLVCLGTTSEYPTLTDKEMLAIKEFTIEIADNRIPIVLGIGSNDTRKLINQITKMDYTGISAVLSVAPFYNKPSQKGLFEHFRLVADSCSLPVIIYNVPGRTGSNITADTTLKLVEECPKIIAIKEASGNMAQCMEILRQKPKGFELLSGEDALTLPLMAMGAKGVISVTANAMPKHVSSMVNLLLKDSCRKATLIHNELLPLTNALFEEGNPCGIKTALEILGIAQNYVRLPLVKASKTLYNKIQTIIGDIQ